MTLANAGFSSLVGLVNLCFDRRRGGRVRGGGDIAVVDVEASRVFHGQILDASASGCRVALCRVMAVRKGMIVECHTADAPGRSIASRRARVVWTRRSKSQHGRLITLAGLEYFAATTMRMAA